MNIFEAIILAIIEGLTEFLPVSSTGHMIIASSMMGIQSDEFVKLFTVAIQFGAILSVVVLYFKRFFKSFDFDKWKEPQRRQQKIPHLIRIVKKIELDQEWYHAFSFFPLLELYFLLLILKIIFILSFFFF